MKKNQEKLKSMKKEELVKEVMSLKEQIRVLRFKAEGSKSKNVKETLALKKQVARAMTIMNVKVIK
jgi:ribosomal protein L29